MSENNNGMIIYCAACGSLDVRRDAWAEWDEKKGDWVLGAVFDNGHCETCGDEARLEEANLVRDGEGWRHRLDDTLPPSEVLFATRDDARTALLKLILATVPEPCDPSRQEGDV